MDSFLLDIRFALRSFGRRRVFAAVAAATIALAIGAATSIYSVVDGVLFRSLPYHREGRLVAVWQTDSMRKKQALLASNWDRLSLDYTDFITWRAKQTSFDAIGVSSGTGFTRTDGPQPEQVDGTRVSPGFFELLGVRPLLGRTFLPGEDVVNGPAVVMLSYEAWRSQFGARDNVIGSTVRFNDKPYEIVGVLPEGFTIQRGRTPAPFWIPAGQNAGDVGKRNHSFRAIGRLKPAVSLERATVETNQLLNAGDAESTRGVRITDFIRDETRDVRAPLLILLGAVGLLLLIACVNVATLLLGEATTRDLELSARIALGATRGRIVRQLLTESVLLAAVGSTLGVVLAWWGTKAIVALAPDRIPGIRGVHVDLRVLGAALAATAATGILFGLAPALSFSGDTNALLRTGKTVRGRGSLQRAMIAAELALSVVLLIGAGLLTRSLWRLSAVDPGFRADHLLMVEMSGRGQYWKDTTRNLAFFAQASPAIRAVPGVTDVSLATTPPFNGGTSSSSYLLQGETEAAIAAHKHEALQRTVAANYFSLMGIPLLSGRAFNDDDRLGAAPVAVISEAAARRDFPNESAIGKQVRHQGVWRTIVGVVRDVKITRLSADDQASIYVPLSQDPTDVPDIVVRTSGDPAAFAGSIRAAIQPVDERMMPRDVKIMTAEVARSFSEERFRTALVGLFGFIAAVLAAVGMFGVTARAVSRRTREVGIRVALGAQARAVIGMIVGQTLAGVGIGVAIGALLALPAAKLLTPYLFGISAFDPVTYIGIFAFLGAISLISSWFPARRAGEVEPAIVLRGE